MAIWTCSLVFALSLAACTEARVIYRDPNVLEVDSSLFIVDEGGEPEFHLILEEMVREDKGAFTPWLNEDHADMKQGSLGDFEWLREFRRREEDYGECVVPCSDSSIFAMEVDVLGTEDDQFIMENCVNITPAARRPQQGFYCINMYQRRSTSLCRRNAACEQYMTSECQCPDYEVRYFCQNSTEEREQYCDHVASVFAAGLESRKRSMGGKGYDALAEDFRALRHDKHVDVKAVERGDVDAVADEVRSQDNMKELLQELVDDLKTAGRK